MRSPYLNNPNGHGEEAPQVVPLPYRLVVWGVGFAVIFLVVYLVLEWVR